MGPGSTSSGTSAPSEGAADAEHRIFEGRPAFEAILREAFERIAARRPARVLLCDDDFAAWPLGERAVVDALDRWAGPNRRLVLLGRRFDEVARRHPRWVAWRRTRSHLVSCRTNTEVPVDPWPTLLLVPDDLAVVLVDPERTRGWWSTDPRRQVAATERFDALSQRSVETFPATTLGL